MRTVLYRFQQWVHRSRIALVALCCGVFYLAAPQPEACAQVRTDSVRVYFPSGQSKFIPSFRDNGKSIDAFISSLKNSWADSELDVQVHHVSVSSSASPEGALSLNERLARERQKSIMDYLEGRLKVAHPEADRSTRAIDWDMLSRLVKEDAAMPAAYRDQIQAKLDSPDPSSVNDLKGTDAWKYLMDNVFPQMRTTLVVFVWDAWPSLSLPELSYEQNDSWDACEDVSWLPDFAPLDASSVLSVAPVAKLAPKHAIVAKLNLLALPALVLHVGVEIQPLDHISINLPVYYSGINWFTETIKFRTFAVQPEVRYWLKDNLHGLFFGAHATFGWYNVAWGGDFRYQDHARKTPTFGGGINVGYKVSLGRDENCRWGLEFGLGGGVLPLHYDIYYNVKNGRLAGEDTKTYIGLDQAFVSLTYRIGQLKCKKQ